MLLYDTLAHKKKPLKPRSAHAIEIFVCGPTVYDYSHIGHARTYIAFDAFVKFLRSKDYAVRYVQNITDIDDKIIERASALGQDARELARRYEDAYYEDMKALGVDSVDEYARATDYIQEIANQTERLIAKGYAYEVDGEGIYYDISKFPEYGKLSKRTVGQAEDAVSRIDDSIKKRNRGDFAIWKISKPKEPRWQSPWGEGRPGWHIEDTAITEKHFGPQYDIHGGARDLVFPHHEAEIAQMEAVSGRAPLVRHWMHTGFLTIGGEKMSKSLGNFVSIRNLLEDHSKEAFRLFILSSHYRSPIDYQKSAIAQAEENVKRLREFRDRLAKYKSESGNTRSGLAQGKKFVHTFDAELEDDFNTPRAFAALFDFVREVHSLLDRHKLNARDIADALQFLRKINSIFDIIPQELCDVIPRDVSDLAEAREKLRHEEKWEQADEVRLKIEKMGYKIEDARDGPEIKKAQR